MKSPITRNTNTNTKAKGTATRGRIIALALLAATATGIASFPLIQQAQAIQTAQTVAIAPTQSHRIEVCSCSTPPAV